MQGRDATATLSTPSGAQVTISVSQIDIANDDTQDPRLFEDDYDVASATGFRVWEASSVFVTLLRQPEVQRQFAGQRVLELGSGTGFLAMAAASHPAANCNALGFFRVMIEGCGGCGGCGACGGGVGGDGRRCVHLRASCNA